MTEKRVLIVVMPFLPLERPALGPGLLKRNLKRDGIACDVRHFHFRFADHIGFDLYQRFAYCTPTHDLAGEWLFTRALYGGPALSAEQFEAYARANSRSFYDSEFLAQIEYCRGVAVRFIEECLTGIEPGKYDVVGFSTTFQQNLASLALAQALKRRETELRIVFGGANCEDSMGEELHRAFPFVDYVCSGEADFALPALVRAIRSGEEPVDVPGVSFRRNGESVRSTAPQQLVEDMDSLAVPDHSDFLEAYRASTASLYLKPQLTMETSRGCWWGQKHHCTFCGLNGLGMKYRSKSVERAYAEVTDLVRTYGIPSFFNTDNILNMSYFSTLFPMLERHGIRVELYYEMKANLKKNHLRALRRIGTRWIQPGIESLSSHVLALMDKGVKAIQNVQVLKWARELGMSVTWNVICGFPGERPEDYKDIARIVRAISHLQPPASFAGFRADRFSPVFRAPERWGLKLRPFGAYRLCYPSPGIDLDRLAYFFTYDSVHDDATRESINEAWTATEEWRQNRDNGTFIGLDSGGFLLLIDTRAGRPKRQYLLAGERRAIYRALDTALSVRSLMPALCSQYPQYEWTEAEVRQVLGEFEKDDLVLREGDLYLSLALIPDDEPNTVQYSAAIEASGQANSMGSRDALVVGA